MAASIFTVLNDIAALMDDTAVMVKVAAKKTAGVLGDDLAVGAEQGSQFRASRELPVIWAIIKGSALNKIIILPLAFLLSYFAEWLIIPILMLGGVYLAYEGFEKVMEYVQGGENSDSETDDRSEEKLLVEERSKVKGAIATDFILSIEIIIIALGTMVGKPLLEQIIVVSAIAALATIAVYGIVALLIRLDDIGFWLHKKGFFKTGTVLIKSLPPIVRSLGVIGMLAMFLVAGGIFIHNLHSLHSFIPEFIPGLIAELIVGFAIGLLAYIIVEGYNYTFKSKKIKEEV